MGVAALGAVSLIAGLSSGASAATKKVRKPVVKSLANPGVVQGTDGRWVIHGTGSWASHSVTVSKGTSAAGPYAGVQKRRLLKESTVPTWMGATKEGERNRSIWAPSVARSGGTYVAYFAVTVKGAGSARCIGTGVSTNARGPFTASPKALACWKGSGAKPYDQIASEGKGFSLIDPTPTWLSSTQLVLTYKTQIKRNGKWHTTTRLLQLDPADPTRVAAQHGKSIKISDARSKYIEENPVLVKRGSRYTLFTSFGWYGTCNYRTRYHQSKNLWSSRSWLKAKHTNLKFPKNTNTCGNGNAQVVNTGSDKWLIFFNGHANRKKTPGGPSNVYVGTVKWKSAKPYVSKVRS
ncbi:MULTISPECIES: family 43 glycosylhydrolase [Aeromicrobium]|uniref:family 43 glycosylhydrolase n=1 Tax=Aeromicrobium TaxID=2040 RepID=UPI00188FB4DE|nr:MULTISPECIES: family 43 glycosylhydrolase [Aeromicrobium]